MDRLCFVSQEIKDGEIIFVFEWEGKSYPYAIKSEYIKSDLDDHLVANIGLSLTPYLFNLCDFDEIVIETSYFSPDQLAFFEEYFLKGMAEFRYVNDINPDKKINFKLDGSIREKDRSFLVNTSNKKAKALLMMGGGKDSLVSKQILDEISYRYDYYTVNVNRPTQDIILKLNEEEKLINIDLVLNEEVQNSNLSGHKPGSSFWAFISLIACVGGGYNEVISSNEYSANFPQIERQEGISINHQYTKSFEFERNFQEYVRKYLVEGYNYFSLLRPFYELQIARAFAGFGKYFEDFISCNVSYKEGKWCCSCAKCAFVYCILAPFLKDDQIMKIWGKHVLENRQAAKYIYELISDRISPLECVGTEDETISALQLLKDAGYTDRIHLDYREKILKIISAVDRDSLRYIYDFNDNHNIPARLFDKVEWAKFLGGAF